MNKQVLVTFSLSMLCVGVRTCNFPPALWCSTKEISQACQVEEQCLKYLQVDKKANLVDFTLYYESLCPDCKEFFKNQLEPAVKAVGKIMNVTLIPYGNAMERQSGDQWKFTCQHGPEECTGNIIETCAIHLTKHKPVFPFLSCMENSPLMPEESFQQCAAKYEMNYTAIYLCSQGRMGNKLEHEMAVLTNKLQPPHTFVPWVTLNGVHTDDIQKMAQENLVKLICDSYKGQKPKACMTQEPKQCLMEKKPSGKPSPVSLDLYYESLCPFCKIFITRQLYPVYKAVGSDVLNITLVPFGNAKEMPGNKYKYTCQHGPEECFGNTIETCAIYLLKDFNEYFEYINCIESSEKMPNESSSECAEKQGLDYKSISFCANGEMGNRLEHQMAEVTDNLNPPHKYVPWIVLNGKHTEDMQRQAQENLLNVICDLYTGPKPAACRSLSSDQKCMRT